MKKDNFLKGAFIATVCLVITKILGILYVIPFYSIIGEKGSILYGCAYNIYALFINLSTVGLPLAISKLVSEYNTLKYYHLKQRSYKLASRIMIITAIITTLLLIVFAPNLAKYIIPDNNYGNTISDITLVIRVSATAIIFVTLISMIRGYMQGMKYIKASSISQVIEQLVRVLVIVFGSYIYLKLIGPHVSIAVSIAVFGATAGAIFALFYLLYKRKQIPKDDLKEIKESEKEVTNKQLLKKIIGYTIPFVVMGFIGASFELVDMFTVVRTLTSHGFETETAAVIMNIVTTLGSKLNVIITAVASGIVISLLPNLTGDFVKKNYTEVKNKINRTLQIVIYITIPMAVGLSLLAKPVWTIFYGNSEFGPKVFMVSIFIAVFNSISSNIMIIMQSVNRYKGLFTGLILGFLFNAITNVPFMHLFYHLGLPIYYGNLFATMIGYTIMISISLYDLNKVFKVNYKETLKQFSITIISVIIMSLVIIGLKQLLPFNTNSRLKAILVVLIETIIGIIIYFIITYKTKSFQKIIGNGLFKRKK